MTKKQGLGRIQRVDLRDAWPREATDFTPWLAEHLSELADVLGWELELHAQEAPVGNFSLDLLARVSGTSRTAIIENQLEQTNHDHLGKLLTYAGGYDANLVVWVAKQFRDEHRQALDWLNQHTDEDTEFFGVLVEVWSIDGSRPAPRFNVVVAPNEWRRQAVRNVRAGNRSEKSLRYEVFFQTLIDTLRSRGFTTARKGQPQNWYAFSAGHAQRIQYGANFAQGNKARVEVYVDNNDRDWNKQFFDRLLQQREAIESELSESLDWERLEHRRASRIAAVRDGNIEDDQADLDGIRDWMVEKLFAFKQVFGPRLDKLAREFDGIR